MPWGKSQIGEVAVRCLNEDYAAFEEIGLAGIPDARVLDVGCFDGLHTVLALAPYGSVGSVVGVDPDREAIAEASSRTEDGRFSFVCAPFESFDAREGSFDLVCFSHVLQHLEDKRAAARMAFRLLAPGGFIVVKTVDDGMKSSSPDPDGAMARAFSFYEEHVLPATEHTRFTDRYFGRACPGLLADEGFEDVTCTLFTTSTVGMGLSDRRALFERCAYFRRGTSLGGAVAAEASRLVEAWGALFEDEGYCFSTTNVVVVARKPGSRRAGSPPEGMRFAAAGAGAAAAGVGVAGAGAGAAGVAARREGAARAGARVVRQMREADLGGVMSIEIEAFPDPWSPLAFAMELRHNPAARYIVACGANGGVEGFAGWWVAGECAAVTQIATKASARGGGIGRLLVERAAADARSEGCRRVRAEVRAGNGAARSFYAALGFAEAGRIPRYYQDPPDDAIIMERPLGE